MQPVLQTIMRMMKAPVVAVGNLAYFYSLRYSTGYTADVRTYNLADNTHSAAAALASERRRCAGWGNTSYGYIGAGGNMAGAETSVIEKRQYAGNVNSTAANNLTASVLQYGRATTNATAAIINLGYVTNAWVATTNKFTYSGEAVAGATSLSATPGSTSDSAIGNSSVGIFPMSNGNCATCKYTYSGDITATATTLTNMYGDVGGDRGAITSTTVGLIVGGYQNVATTCKYTYSGDSVASGTVLNTGRAPASKGQGGSSVTGVIMGGYDGSSVPVTAVETYSHGGATWTAMTALTAGAYAVGGTTCTSPAGL